jgi:serine/threonine protein kinase
MVTPVSSDKYIGEQVAGQFHIRQRIGAGGMGSVYKAEQPDMNRHVAVKILHPRYLSRPDLVSRFRREAPRHEPPVAPEHGARVPLRPAG